ncbi:ribosome recycling factor [Gautieria morchelliformis]|nr:ribosome recycling factor [Gautieria morchelliformis]
MSFVLLRRGFVGRSIIAKWTIKTPVVLSFRSYASKNKGKAKQAPQSDVKGSHATSTSGFIPTSQRALSDEAAQAEYDKTSTKMVAAVDWLRKEVAGITARAIGHVTPAILDSVKVILPENSKELRLEEVATVGVREGTNLLVTLYEDKNLKYVEKAIYAAKLPNIAPQKVDARTLKIVIPRPTMEARAALLNTASKTSEDTRVQLRKLKDASMRKHKWKPRSDEGEQFQKLCDTRIKEVDQILTKAKRELGT